MMPTNRSLWAPWCAWMPKWLLYLTVLVMLIPAAPLYIVAAVLLRCVTSLGDVWRIVGAMLKSVREIDEPLLVQGRPAPIEDIQTIEDYDR